MKSMYIYSYYWIKSGKDLQLYSLNDFYSKVARIIEFKALTLIPAYREITYSTHLYGAQQFGWIIPNEIMEYTKYSMNINDADISPMAIYYTKPELENIKRLVRSQGSYVRSGVIIWNRVGNSEDVKFVFDNF